MASRVDLVVAEEEAGQRLDLCLAGRADLGLTRSHIQRLLAQGLVQVDGRREKAGYKVRPGQTVMLEIPDPEPVAAWPEEIALDVVFEDADILVINKPRGMVVHPAPGHARGTLVNAVLARCPDLSAINDVVRPGIVHRLDRDTTGLLVVAKNEAAYRGLQGQLKDRTMGREYLALVLGQPPDEGRVDAPIGRHRLRRKEMAVTPGGRPAATSYRVIERFPGRDTRFRGSGYALVQLKLETGRTHQIRVHMAHVGHPVAGDPVYGARRDPAAEDRLGLLGQALHAARLTLTHPRTGERLAFAAPPPPDLAAAIERLRASHEH